MSRSGYCDAYPGWELNLYRGAVASAIRGKSGQAFLREMAASLDSLPVKALAAHSLTRNGVCAIGSVALTRGLDVSDIEAGPDYDDEPTAHLIAARFGIANALAAEIVFENDETGRHDETPAQRFVRMRRWTESHIATRESKGDGT